MRGAGTVEEVEERRWAVGMPQMRTKKAIENGRALDLRVQRMIDAEARRINSVGRKGKK